MTLDVIVIGAGVAGLSAAVELQKAGLSFAILEARDRAGGRINTVDSKAGNVIELGAEFLHGSVPDLMRIVESENLQYEQAKDDHLALVDGQLVDAEQYFENTQIILDKLEKRADARDVSFAEFGRELINEEPSYADAVEQATGYVEDLNACKASEVSIAWLRLVQKASEETNGDQFYRLNEGYSSLVDRLLSKLPAESIKLSHRVSEVTWESGKVIAQVRTLGQSHQLFSRAAIITLPVSLLQESCLAERRLADSLNFIPELSEKVPALRSIVFGQAYRVVLEFKSQIWKEYPFEKLGFIHSRTLPFTTWWSQAPASTPVLTAWAAGPKAIALNGKSKHEITAAALESLSVLSRISRKELESQLLDSHLHDWTLDPYSHGAYSYVLAGGDQAARELALPINDTLFFAGEATDWDGFTATVPGALRSGVRAAKEVTQVLAV